MLNGNTPMTEQQESQLMQAGGGVDLQQGASGLIKQEMMPDYSILYCEFPESILGADAENIKHPVKLKFLGHIPLEEDFKDLEPTVMMEKLCEIYENPGSLRVAEGSSELFFLPLKDSDLILKSPTPVKQKHSSKESHKKKKKKKQKQRKHSPKKKLEDGCSFCGNPGSMWDNEQKVCVCCAGVFSAASVEGVKKCSLCPATLLSAPKLYLHVKSKHPQALFTCVYCGKQRTDRTTLKDHLRMHTGEKPFGCQTCGAYFSYRANLIRHKITVHERVSRHPCNVCDKRFTHPHLLRLHQRVHNNERPYQCADCPKGFRSRSDMVRHTAVHMDLRPHVCHLCQHTFKTKGQLNNHLTLHKAEKADFKCKECGEMFTKTGIIQHVKSAH